MPRARVRFAAVVLPVLIASLAGCYNDPNKRLDQMQESLDLSASLNELQSKTSELQFALDSLRGVVARQDSTIARLANLAGVPYVR